MDDLTVWMVLLALVGVGAVVTRANPQIAYSRALLIKLSCAVVVGAALILATGFYAAPNPLPSGIIPAAGG